MWTMAEELFSYFSAYEFDYIWKIFDILYHIGSWQFDRVEKYLMHVKPVFLLQINTTRLSSKRYFRFILKKFDFI